MISAVLVVAKPEHLAELRVAIEGHEWAEVHHVESESGRIIVTLETASANEATSRILELRDLPHVILAEMVEHYVEDESGA